MVRLWDVAGCFRTPEAFGARPRVLEGHAGIVLSVAFLPDEALLGPTASLFLWDTRRHGLDHLVVAGALTLVGLPADDVSMFLNLRQPTPTLSLDSVKKPRFQVGDQVKVV
jgi:hypothetical protein